ncbi:MAG: bifunctional pyr operon transcriptional regulator/uracil phosphoribosyltransferase PyrR [Deltaproteobacteria bacterium]|jgi:pyrimidine operon attenuation protein/uracil phosphoribosyltransferase|nr:bifunctional pyr operon transcriptional regulator/uracil phosphoribosyltransferase PyrR [Deltaproteobacteria bacterium]
MTSNTILFGPQELARGLSALSGEILAARPETPVLVGIRRGGVTLAARLASLMAASLGQEPPMGSVDINLYRDDWTKVRALPKVGRTEIRQSLDHLRVILVDDVLFTGRTVRAALEELTNFGRPSRIELAVLVDRGQREMPIQADYKAFTVSIKPAEMVEVCFAGEGGEDRILLLNSSPKT